MLFKNLNGREEQNAQEQGKTWLWEVEVRKVELMMGLPQNMGWVYESSYKMILGINSTYLQIKGCQCQA
jgi:hypothetical protein